MKYIQKAKTESEQAKKQKDKYQKETEDEKQNFIKRLAEQQSLYQKSQAELEKLKQ